MIATFSRNSADRIAAERHAMRERLCATHHELHDDFRDALADAAVICGIVNAAEISVDHIDAMVDRVARRSRPPALALVHGNDPAEIDVLVEMTRRMPYVQSVYRKYHDLEVCLRASPLEWAPCATPAIMRVLGVSLGPQECRILGCCVVAAERKTTIPEIAAAAGTTEDAVREVARRLGFDDWCEFRAWLRTLHAIHRIEKSGASPGLAAELGGFQNEHGLENHTLRTLCRTPKQLVGVGFDRLVR